MISLGTISSASGAAGYYAADNYYTADENRDASAWLGEGAEALGLEGPVDEHAFAEVLVGELPDGSTIDAKRGEHRPGLDLTFSVSKSVSLVALLGKDPRVVEALKASVKATLKWVEKNLVEARVWDGKGQRPERTGKLVAATFLHDVSRSGDPQLHVHAVVANATLCADGKWRALKNDALYDNQHVIGAVHNADLRARLEALGYVTEPAKNAIDGSFEIKGVFREAIDAFSTRSAEIKAALAVEGRGSPREREIAALSTRDAKEPELSAEARMAAWESVAAAVGFDARALVDGAIERSGRGETALSRVVAGIRGVHAQGMAIAARMRLTPRDGDALVPERAGQLAPVAWAAAQAVASASRDLSEREAAFGRYDLISAALERGGPVTVTDIETRIELLEARGLLISDGDRMLTTHGAAKLEASVLVQVREGVGKVEPVLSLVEARVQAQVQARELGLRRLNPNQEAAAALMLGSKDRVIAVQGVAGAGKSAVLKPVAAIAAREGRAVIGLAIASRVARDLGQTGAKATTVAGFLARHARIADGTASSVQLNKARAELGGAIVIVDETSMVGTAQMAQLVALANRLEFGRLALIGDTRQLGAIDAGKPFEQLQKDGIATAELPDNLRATSPVMKAAVAALNVGDTRGAFEALANHTVEVDQPRIPAVAAELWLGLDPRARDATLLLASGRAMRTAANEVVQAGLRERGEIGGEALRLDVLDRVTVTREGARSMRAYQEGRVVEFSTKLAAQGFARGDRGIVTGSGDHAVTLRMPDGRERVFRPDKLPANLKHDAVSVYAVKPIEIYTGDRIRFTTNDRERDIANSDRARVETITPHGVTVVSLADGQVHELPHGDRMLERFDLAYAINVHVAQGVTTEHGIIMMSAAERQLSSAKSFLVAASRVADTPTLVTDSGSDLKRALVHNAGEKTSALDLAKPDRSPRSLELGKALSSVELARSIDFGIGM